MAFPTTGILDAFTGGNENPIATNWSGPWATGAGQLQRLSNQLTEDATIFYQGSWYDISTVGPDFEAYITIVRNSDNNNDELVLGVKQGLPDGTGYAVVLIHQVGTDTVQLRVNDTPLGADISQDFADGDGLGIERTGTTINAYRRSSGVWSLIGTRTDSTYTLTGNIYVQTGSTDPQEWVMDDLGGGTLVLAEKQSYYAYRRRATR